MLEREEKQGSSTQSRARAYRQVTAACARGFRVRSRWLIVLGLVLAIAGGYLFLQNRTSDTEGGFPNYMQNVDR
jgi:hypothetical protein